MINYQLNYWRRIWLCIFLLLSAFSLYSETKTMKKVTMSYDVYADGSIKVIDICNNSAERIWVYVDGYEVVINKDSSAKIKRTAKRRVNFNFATSAGGILWKKSLESAPKDVPKDVAEIPVANEPVNVNISEERSIRNERNPRHREPVQEVYNPTYEEKGYTPVAEKINSDPYFGSVPVETFVEKCDSYTKALSGSADKYQFILDNDLNTFISDSENEIKRKRDEISMAAHGIVSASKVNDQQGTLVNLVIETLNNRLSQREQALVKLKDAVIKVPEPEDASSITKSDIIYYSIVILLVLIIVTTIFFIIRGKKKKTGRGVSKANGYVNAQETNVNPTIEVRRRTTSILKKQDISDVKDNPSYLHICASDFVSDSAVRNIYIKNTCIREIYDMYEEDLRNTENPKEDGCMALGRWVHDVESDTYDISLETVVMPGDDAIFKEYELNFGGKIKLRLAEKLRRLRRETGLQYDLVCWIHSHPGLGVFFSNSDEIVQTQLKHAQHPHFLIAFVVDILTSNQELGIFTFKKDGSMNSKGDLIKMYSLEEMYKWSLQNEVQSFNPENYYNILQDAKVRIPTFYGVELNNSSIIDLTQLTVNSGTGIAGWIVGSQIDGSNGKEYVVSKIAGKDEKPTAGLIGALVIETHVSLPTIQRLLNAELQKLSFVAVYSSKLQTITTIPVINGELVNNEQFYGDVNIENLKIWTRRKR
jgi:hypothetical protein